MEELDDSWWRGHELFEIAKVTMVGECAGDHDWSPARGHESFSELQSGRCCAAVATDGVVTSRDCPELPLEQRELPRRLGFCSAVGKSFLVRVDALWATAGIVVVEVPEDAQPELHGEIFLGSCAGGHGVLL